LRHELSPPPRPTLPHSTHRPRHPDADLLQPLAVAVMVDPFKGMPYRFGALHKTFGRLYVRCDVCPRFALLQLGRNKLSDVDYRTKRFSCSVCGDEACSR
jgi:hypothetical protein